MQIGITDRIVDIGPQEAVLERHGARFHFLDSLDEQGFDDDVLASLDALLVWHARITEHTARRLRRCKLVVRYGVGYDQVDVAALTRAGIRFANNPAYCIEEVADTAAAMILNGVRGITRHDLLARGHRELWQEHSLPTWRSGRRSVGLVGLGRIGTATALRLKAFGFRLSAYDPFIDQGLSKSLGIRLVETLPELLADSDVVSVHCPLTERTEGMIDAAFLGRMKPDAVLVNTARGKMLASLDALETHLRANPEFRAFLDVLPDEPPGAHPLIDAWRDPRSWLAGRLVINPHNAYFSDASAVDQRVDAIETVRLALVEGVFRHTIV